MIRALGLAVGLAAALAAGLAAALAAALAAGLAAPAHAAPPASDLFGAVHGPSDQAPASVGGYAAGCLAGAVPLAADGPGWQAMRPSRDRAWGRPEATAFVARLAEAGRAAGWSGLLVGDIGLARGGPMRSGHRSHQIGLDIDIWLTPAPPRPLSAAERESMSAASMVAPDRRAVTRAWSPAHAGLLRTAAQDPAVARIFVNAAIKAELCRAGPEGWMRKLRPWWGHDSHFHVRLACPDGDAGCVDQAPPPPGPGCDAALEWWFSDEALNPKPEPGAPARRALTLADLPPSCRGVLDAAPR
jgi:penicillin-insensitive murein endopeptidase